MIFKLIILPKTYNYYTNVYVSEFTQVTAVTIIVYMAWKFHTTYMFVERFEAC